MTHNKVGNFFAAAINQQPQKIPQNTQTTNQVQIHAPQKNELPNYDYMNNDILAALQYEQNNFDSLNKQTNVANLNPKLPHNYQLNGENYNCVLDKASLDSFCEAVYNEGANQLNGNNGDQCYGLSALYNEWIHSFSDYADENDVVKLGFDGVSNDDVTGYNNTTFNFPSDEYTNRDEAKQACLDYMAGQLQSGNQIIIQVGALSRYTPTGVSRHYVSLIGLKEPLSNPISENDFIFADVSDGRVEPLLECEEQPNRDTFAQLQEVSGFGRFLIAGYDTGNENQDYGFQVLVKETENSKPTYSI